MTLPGVPTYRNKKTGKLYYKVGTCRNCTNAQDGQVMVSYVPVDAPTDCLVREQEEFDIKFEEVPHAYRT